MTPNGDTIALDSGGTAVIKASESAAPKPARSLRDLALRGSAWTLAGYGASQVLRLGSNLVLARLLFPEAFGTAALVSLFIAGLQMFSDVGLGPNIIRSRRGDDPAFLDTAWTLQVARGLMLWLGTVLIAWPVSVLYDNPQLARMIPVAGLTALFSGFGSTSLFLCTRHLRLGRLTSLDLCVQAITLVATVVLARIHPSAWALIFGGLVGLLFRVALSHLVLGGPPNRFRWDREASHELFGFGKWIFLNTAITFLAMQADRLVLGKLVPMREFGLYSIAYMLSQVPRSIINRLSDTVVYPVVSRSLHEGRGLDRVHRIRHAMILVSGAICAALIVAAQPLVSLLYDARYQVVGPLLAVLAVGTWLQTVSVSYGVMLLAAGQPRPISIGLGLRLAAFLGLVGPVITSSGVLGVAMLVSGVELGVLVACAFGASRLGLISRMWGDARLILAIAVTLWLLFRASY